LDILEIDLSNLMGGSPLTVPCTLAKNGIGIDLNILVDTGANGFVFIDTTLADQLCESLGLQLTVLPRTIQAKGYDGQKGQVASHCLTLNLILKGRRQYNIPFIVLKLGAHEAILSRKWLEYFHVNLDVAKRMLIWPPENTPTPSFMRLIRIDRNHLVRKRTSQSIQKDIVRRDQALAKEDKRRQDGKHKHTSPLQQPQPEAEISPVSLGQDDTINLPCNGNPATSANPNKEDEKTTWFPKLLGKRTWFTDTSTALRTIGKALTDRLTASYDPKPRKRTRKTLIADRKLATIDIGMISANGFVLNCQDPGAVLFSITLEEIDREILDQEATDQELVAQKIPVEHQDLKDVFSQAESDELPPHRTIDHKIVLDQENSLGFSPLYHMSLAELQTVKQYLLDNLHKGFIVPSQAPYASPVLFVKKSNGSLRFCIDYRKLNAITRKDRYPLPLIDETLARISRAKIFTKLDIRQAFHRIRIDPSSEDLTTFRTRYGSYKCKVLPFGLTNGPATFQHYMNETLMEYLDDFCTTYLDDILIYSENPLEHIEYVCKVLLQLWKAGLQANIKKCEFNVTCIKYLGFIVSTNGIEVDLEKVEAIYNWKQLTTVKGV
jgi:predicted aspartyl protease